MQRESPVRILGHELRIAARRLRHDRWAAGGAILAAALGAGLNTAVFAMAYGILLRPLPYAQPDRLVVVSAGGRPSAADDSRSHLAAVAGVSGLTAANIAALGSGAPPVAAGGVSAGQTFSRTCI